MKTLENELIIKNILKFFYNRFFHDPPYSTKQINNLQIFNILMTQTTILYFYLILGYYLRKCHINLV